MQRLKLKLISESQSNREGGSSNGFLQSANPPFSGSVNPCDKSMSRFLTPFPAAKLIHLSMSGTKRSNGQNRTRNLSSFLLSFSDRYLLTDSTNSFAERLFANSSPNSSALAAEREYFHRFRHFLERASVLIADFRGIKVRML